MSKACIFDAIRSPRGDGRPGGALYQVKPVQLLARCLQALQRRSGIDDFPLQVDDFIVGCNTPAADQGYNIARAGLLHAGWRLARGGMQINRFNTSSLEAINLAAARIEAGYDDLIIAGGLECMSRVPTWLNRGPMMNDPETIVNSHYIPQGVAADLVATTQGLSRSDLDHFALRSHQLAIAAQDANLFDASLEPITDANGLPILDRDALPKPSLKADDLADLPSRFSEMGLAGFDTMALHRFPLISRILHNHTIGNTSAPADGAALCLLGSQERGSELGLKARARIRSVAMATVDATMLTGGETAARLALQKAELGVEDIDLWEFNESFAAPAICFQRGLELAEDQFNVLGGSIALGEPLGAVGGMMLCHLLDQLEKRDQTFGSLTIDAGSGLAMSTIIERLEL